MKKIYIIIILIFILTSCLTPKSEPIPEKEVVEEIIPEPIVVDQETIIEEKPVESDIYVATEEEYDKTFEEIEELITKLNKIISSGNYNTWKTYLSEQYILERGNKEYLAKISENPVLKDYGIKIKTLKDYFSYIVAPSRSYVVIDEIQFVTEDIIKALTFKNNSKFVVYMLIKGENGWIISD